MNISRQHESERQKSRETHLRFGGDKANLWMERSAEGLVVQYVKPNNLFNSRFDHVKWNEEHKMYDSITLE